MRSCIYCGKELAPGERCNCRQSAAHHKAAGESSGGNNYNNTSDNSSKHNEKKNTRKEKKEQRAERNSTQNAYQGSGYNDPTRTAYRTGYTKKDNPFKEAFEKARVKKKARKATAYRRGQFGKGFFRDLLTALRFPIQSVQNPKRMSMWQMIVLWAMQGALAWLGIFFITTHAARGPFALIGNLLAFHGIEGYKTIMYILLTILSGGIAGVLVFFLYTGIFFGINRFIMRDTSTRYSSFCERLAMTALPFSAIALVGTALSLISITTLITLLVCGAAVFVVLTYEALKTQWAWVPQDRTLMCLMLGFFIIAIAAGYIIRLS